MKIVKQALIGSQVLTLCFGLTTLLAGCGGGGVGDSSGGVTAEDQMKKAEAARGAMEAAGKAQKAAKK